MFYLQLCVARGGCFIAFFTFSNTKCPQKWSNEAFLLKVCAACWNCPMFCSLFYRIEFLQDYMSLVVATAGVCLALMAAKFAVGIHPAWHDTTICCAQWCWASRYSACASQLCWLLSSSSSASARSDKCLSLLQANVSSTLRMGWPAYVLIIQVVFLSWKRRQKFPPKLRPHSQLLYGSNTQKHYYYYYYYYYYY